MFDLNLEQQFKQHALAEYPKEACGLIVDGNTFVPMKNVHETPKINFRMNTRELLEYHKDGRVNALLHSHTGPDNNYPSRADMKVQNEMQIPWGIVHIGPGRYMDGVFYFGDQVPIAPFVGRAFRPGVHDCYTLLRDIYRAERNIVLPIFPREGYWWKDRQDILKANFTKAGFVQIDKSQLQKHDVMLCRVNCPPENQVYNHIAVLRDKGMIFHHLNKRLSRPDPAQAWLSTSDMYLRYKGIGGNADASGEE